MKKIDILLPYWGDFALLKKTINSIIAQTSNKWTLTIIDDHYPSLEAQKYCSTLNDKRIVYYRNPKNIGITNNFNLCIEKAASEYCMIPGCDDMLLPNYVETALKNIGDNDFYQPNVEIIDANDKTYLPLADKIKRFLRPNKSSIYSGENLAASLCHGNWLYFPSITWKTKTLKRYRFDLQYKIVEDVVVELDIIKDGGTLFVDKTTTFQYRRFAESLSSKEKTKGGVRFTEEKSVYNHYAKIFTGLRWKKAALAAKLRTTSRVHGFIAHFSLSR